MQQCSQRKRKKKRNRTEESSSSTPKSKEGTTINNNGTPATSIISSSSPNFHLLLSPNHTLGICSSVASRYHKVGHRVGEGTYGIVYQAYDKVTERHVALKRCIPHHESSDGFPLTALREIHSLKICNQHPNIVQLLDIAVGLKIESNERGNVFLVFEYCPCDLANILDQHVRRKQNVRHSTSSKVSPFSHVQVKQLIQQLLSAIQYCHSHSLIHRDIKPSNLLYTTNGTLKLCDFGLSRHCRSKNNNDNKDKNHPPLTPNVVSLWYRAPELLLISSSSSVSASNIKKDDNVLVVPSYYSFPIDLFAIGCVMAELLDGYPLMDGRTELEQVQQMVQCLGTPPSRLYDPVVDKRKAWTSSQSQPPNTPKRIQHYSKPQPVGMSSLLLWDRFEYLSTEGLILLTRLLDYDPNERWTASQALQSKYFVKHHGTETPIRMPTLKELGME